MFRFIFIKLASALFVMAGVVCIVFFLLHLIPGDPVEVMLGESALPTDREALRKELGLDQPILTQFQIYISDLTKLDLGKSLHSKQPITEILAERLPATFTLAASALIIAILIALPLGVISAIRKDTSIDRSAMGFAMLGVSIPNFWMGPILILIFSLWLGWLPVSGNDQTFSIILPALTLGTALAAILSRMIRSSVLEVLNDDYIRTARAKGISEPRIIINHALSNATLPVITVLGLQLGGLLGGAVITETIFSWPGIGQLTIDAIQRRDYPVVQACVLVISLIYVLVNMLTDLAYGWLDPRVRFSE
ncbi:MAG: nickel ABC transporter permease [Gammaproteobacteria bacterium]